MGLDISVWRQLKPLAGEVNTDRRDIVHVHVINEQFAGNIAHLQAETWYSGFPVFGMHAGSYGGYNNFRRKLARLSGNVFEDMFDNPSLDRESIPFFELLNFADNEGCIDWVAAGKLHQDFCDNKEAIWPTLDSYEQQKYEEWITALMLASQPDSLIDFH